jgi:ankyrin repeat protein
MDKTVAFDAIINEDTETINKYAKEGLIGQADESGMTPAHWGAFHGKCESIATLIRNNASLEESDKDGIKPYDWAKRNGHEEAASLIGYKLQADKLGWPLVNWLAKENQLKFLEFFLTEHNINEVDKDFGRSPLHWAVYNAAIDKNRDLLNIILDGKSLYIDLKDSENGQTALCMAAYLNDFETLKTILSRSPKIEIEDNFNYTPVLWAVDRQNEQSLSVLIEAGADITKKNINNISAIEIAEHKENKNIINLLNNSIKFDNSCEEFLILLKDIIKGREEAVNIYNVVILQNQSPKFTSLPQAAQELFKHSFDYFIDKMKPAKNNSFEKDILDKFKLLSSTPANQTIIKQDNSNILLNRLNSLLRKLGFEE